jgi:hypothetical protein
MSTYLLRCYVSTTFVNFTKRMQNHCEADMLCRVAKSYRDWLLERIKSSDEHFHLCAHFMSMSGNIVEFVQAYRCQDSIIIESGYSWFALQW